MIVLQYHLVAFLFAMLVRVIGLGIGVAVLLWILLVRGLPVLFFLKMLPLALLGFLGVAFIYAALAKD